jgi:hypothetical protein
VKCPAIGECQRSADTMPSNAGHLPKAGALAEHHLRVGSSMLAHYHSVSFRGRFSAFCFELHPNITKIPGNRLIVFALAFSGHFHLLQKNGNLLLLYLPSESTYLHRYTVSHSNSLLNICMPLFREHYSRILSLQVNYHPHS